MGRRRAVLAPLALGLTALGPATVDAGGAGRADAAVTGRAERGAGWGHVHRGHHDRHAVRAVRRSTWRYRRVAAAEADGYAQFLTCTQEPGVGAMGTHWVNGALVEDALLDPRHPEVMVYETKRDGTLRLVAVEYVVFRELWDAEHTRPPKLFGQRLHLVEAPNRYGLPDFYALHVWAWKWNPNGVFADWNPRVSCEHAEGDPI